MLKQVLKDFMLWGITCLPAGRAQLVPNLGKSLLAAGKFDFSSKFEARAFDKPST